MFAADEAQCSRTQARRAGYRYPVAMTAALWAQIDIDDGVNSRSATRAHRLDNLLARARDAICATSGTDRVTFSTLGLACGAHCGPGDDGRPVSSRATTDTPYIARRDLCRRALTSRLA